MKDELEERIMNEESCSVLYAILKSLPLNKELNVKQKIKYTNLIQERLNYLKMRKYWK